LAGGFIRYRETETEVHFPDRGKPRVPGRVLVPPPPHGGANFWQVGPFDESSQLEIDRTRSEATRIDHAVQLFDGTWQEYRIVRKRGITVSQDDLDAVLRSERLVFAKVAPVTSTATEAGDTGAVSGTVSAADTPVAAEALDTSTVSATVQPPSSTSATSVKAVPVNDSIPGPTPEDKAESWLVRVRSQRRHEERFDYLDCLVSACKGRWTRKTIRNILAKLRR
jgi:hypothetical protein